MEAGPAVCEFPKALAEARVSAMDGIAELARQIDREKIDRARGMGLAEKFRAGAELFEQACEISRSGIRALHPGWPESEVVAELRRRIRLGKERETIAL